jgi:hypothetical protein
VLRLIGFLLMVTIGAGGFLALDYNMARQLADSEDDGGLTVREYLGGLSVRIASVTGSAATPGLPSALQDMLPKPPEGWTVRPATGEDVTAFLPRERGAGEAKARDLITDMVKDKVSGAAEVVILVYEKADRRVIVKAVRYPDVIFTSDMAIQQRFDLQMKSAEYRGISSMTVRGLDITEDLLPDDMRGRLFMADVGGQIHLRLLAPRRMPDAELVTFFETLHVRALNAAVVDKRDGLGEVPVIVLASALSGADRDAYDADRAARAAAEAAQSREALQMAEAALAAAAGPDAVATEGEQPAQAPAAQCEKGAGGVKRCKVGE